MSIRINEPLTEDALDRWLRASLPFVLHPAGTVHSVSCGTISRSRRSTLASVPPLVVRWLVAADQQQYTGRLCRACMGAVAGRP